MSVSFKDNIVYGGDITFSITGPYRSLGEFFQERFKDDGDYVMLIDASTGQQYTRQEVYEKMISFMQSMNLFGIKEGDVIGLCSENSAEFVITLLGTIALGATAALLSPNYSERELEHAVSLTRPKVFFTSKTPLNKILSIARKNEFVKYTFIFGGTDSTSGATPFAQLINSKRVLHFDPPSIDKRENVAIIALSSGTTGMPKGVQITHMNIMAVLDRQYRLSSSSTPESSSGIIVIPWYHLFGCISMIFTACMKAKLVFLPKFEETAFLGAIEKYCVKAAIIVPPLMVFLAKNPIVDRYNLSSLEFLLCGGASLSKETVNAVKKRTGVPFVQQGYGLTESTYGVLSQNDNVNYYVHDTAVKMLGSVGTVSPGVKAKIIDTETGLALGPNQRGELCLKGDFVMKGYIQDKHSTLLAIQDGWLHTGDIGYFDDNFIFFIVDRIKELIKYKGFQVPPAEIEALLLTNPKIKEAAVVGKPDESAGELPFAFVVKQADAQLTEEDVIKFVADNTSPAKRLRGGVKFVDEIPKNSSGKILRRDLRDMLKRVVCNKNVFVYKSNL